MFEVFAFNVDGKVVHNQGRISVVRYRFHNHDNVVYVLD